MQFELVLTVGLVVMVIFLFLRNFAATIIPSVAVPLSLVGTFGVMYLLGYSLNNLTLMALTISTGFVVDDAIVMIENIARFIEEGDPPLQAALKGSEQIGFTIVSLSVSLIAVLIPLLFMGDIVGPAVPRVRGDAERDDRGLGGRLADADADDVRAAAAGISPSREQRRLYQRVRACFRVDHRLLRPHAAGSCCGISRHAGGRGGTLVATIYLYIIIPKGFFPVQDTGVILGSPKRRRRFPSRRWRSGSRRWRR